ncbi:hypothetical protein P4H42_03575 [Paenibacillus macerans]|uniref:hypothetical protein n=1 Tax=Paenibacillus macerans TaxID=44252 RepID=UPI002DB6FC32|nr:hypothetical protein [Paenibacillus macerans]MEC0328702.1 hypothetical protein [Paenibacillus macerans]
MKGEHKMENCFTITMTHEINGESSRMDIPFPKPKVNTGWGDSPSLAEVFIHAFHLFQTHHEAIVKTRKAVNKSSVGDYRFYFDSPSYDKDFMSIYVSVLGEDEHDCRFFISMKNDQICVSFGLDFVNLIHLLYPTKQSLVDIKQARQIGVEAYAEELKAKLAPIEEEGDEYAEPAHGYVYFENSSEMKPLRLEIEYTQNWVWKEVNLQGDAVSILP